MSWLAPAGFFALLALLSAIAPTAPGAWFDRLLHLFGIGSVSARQTALSLWIVAAIASCAAGFALTELTGLEPWLIAIDAAAIGVAVSLALIWLASRKGSRGTGLLD